MLKIGHSPTTINKQNLYLLETVLEGVVTRVVQGVQVIILSTLQLQSGLSGLSSIPHLITPTCLLNTS